MASQKFNEKKYDFVFSLFFMRIESAPKKSIRIQLSQKQLMMAQF